MTNKEQDSIRLINTAIIKSKEKKINISYQEKLSKVCESPAIKALAHAINYLSENEKISRDQAAVLLVDTVRSLDNIWNDYVLMEGMEKLKEVLKKQTNH
ncbi:MAG: hypothetical protein A2202_08725 [Bdellovibrionales bacterium RIFOXYA1_FULL_36_14]|nr:MAG: hypothetical protein A2202_08725 [Bdellovibrionales bacterium RIFOXYA1_FULL_36_14]